MPSYTRGKKRDNLVFVPVNNLVFFGFKTKDLTALTGISNADITALGHVNLAGTNGFKIVGANAPKPARVTKRIANATPGQQKSVSTYCAYDKLAAALGAGWNLSKQGNSVILRSASSSRGSITAIAQLSDFSLYCFPMNKADFEAYGEELGLQSAINITSDVDRKRLVAGSTMPRPGRASKQLANGSSFSSFYATNTDVLMAGYSVDSEEKVLVDGSPF